MGVTRRQALQVLGVGVTTGALGRKAKASDGPDPAAYDETLGMLYDATRCIGCKACMPACAEANGLKPDTQLSNGLHQAPLRLNSQTKNIIELCQDEATEEQSFVKRQCMHCLEPGCVSGCPFHALSKDSTTGIVSWKADLCIGCRFCEVACPFEVPQFEWANFNPKIVKCELCMHRLPDGAEPACTEVCPTDAVIFGKRGDLMADAKNRISKTPGKYYEDRVYGETEAGGTQVLYLSRVPFAALGLPTLTHGSLAEYSTKYQSILYKWMAIPTLIYIGLVAFIRRSWKHHKKQAEELERETRMMEQL